MDNITIVCVEEIIFEVNNEGITTSFAVEKAEALRFEEFGYTIKNRNGNIVGCMPRHWRSLFSPKTKIILKGAIRFPKEMTATVTVPASCYPNNYSIEPEFAVTDKTSDVIYRGAFDFEELCNGRVVVVPD